MVLKFFLSLCLSSFFTTVSFAQTSSVTISGLIINKVDKTAMPFVNIILKTEKDSAFVTGTVSNEEGRFTLSNIKSGIYILQFSYTGYDLQSQSVLVGSLSTYLDVGTIELQQDLKTIAGSGS